MNYAVAIILTLIVSTPTVAHAQSLDGNVITLEVTGLENQKGKVMCGLYGENGWLEKGRAVAGAFGVYVGNKAICTFENVPAGNYGVAIFHDQDEDGGLSTNFIGIPSEPFCFSNNARGSLGPPSFKAARFSHDGARTQQQCQAR